MAKLNNKYSRIYDAIIDSAQRRNFASRKQAKKELGYVEKHHIVPKCIGGSDDSSNLIFLTAKEHFVCHHLLTKMFESVDISRQMRFALNKMSRKSSTQKRVNITARMFDKIRKDFAADISSMNSGRVNGPMSEDQKIIRSLKNKGVPKSDQARKNMRGPKSEDQLRGLKASSTSKKGTKLSEQEKQKLRKPKKPESFDIYSALRKGIVSAYDLNLKKVVKIPKTEFDEFKNTRYVGLNSKLRIKENG